MSMIGGFIARLGFFFWFPVYLALLVVVAGQTFGMMIAGLRVVTDRLRQADHRSYDRSLSDRHVAVVADRAAELRLAPHSTPRPLDPDSGRKGRARRRPHHRGRIVGFALARVRGFVEGRRG